MEIESALGLVNKAANAALVAFTLPEIMIHRSCQIRTGAVTAGGQFVTSTPDI